MFTIVTFIFAIALLVAVHEWGHFAMARACGVRVLRFSIGFGPTLWGRTSPRNGVEFVICAIPLGGYVKMLDEREGTVPLDQRAFAFNTQPLRKRAAIVAAGPVANLLLAMFLYALVNWAGIEQAEARLSRPVTGSIAQAAGFQGAERVSAVAFEGDDATAIDSFEEFRWWLTRAALAHKDLDVEFRSDGGPLQRRVLRLASMDAREADSKLYQTIGFVSPYSPARLGEIVPDEAAARAGLKTGDTVLSVQGAAIADSGQLRELIRSSNANGAPFAQTWQVRRDDSLLTLVVTPSTVKDGDSSIGRVGAIIGSMPTLVTVRYGFWEGLSRSVVRTWDVSVLSLKMMGQIATGQSSIKNLSGPITIADYAGRSASLGWTQFAVFLALVSISLGVLNLLPLPVLDGGHLMYYLWEFVVGRPLSDAWMERLQRVGLVVLMMMMSIALFNDISRLVA